MEALDEFLEYVCSCFLINCPSRPYQADNVNLAHFDRTQFGFLDYILTPRKLRRFVTHTSLKDLAFRRPRHRTVSSNRKLLKFLVCIQQKESLIQCNRQPPIRLTNIRQSIRSKEFVTDQQSLKPTFSEEVGLVKCHTPRASWRLTSRRRQSSQRSSVGNRAYSQRT
jgi:hypothetical protein